MFNNIQVTLVAFAGGIAFGVLTVYALFFNGLLLGTIGGLAIGAGQRRRVPAADLLARAAGDLVHRRRRHRRAADRAGR